MNEFEKLGLSTTTLEAITKKGFTKPTPIQEQTIPLLLEGKGDVIAQAQTGTGKTACFALPILEHLEDAKQVQALILTPTRELALQVATEIESLKGSRKVKITAIYGGASINDQMDDLRRGAQIVVGTPGRVMDLMKRRKLLVENLKYAVLDEADEMLNMGFLDDIKKILSQTNNDKKMLLFSATMPREILTIAKKFMKNYEMVKDETVSLATELIDQVYYDIMGRDRYTALKRLIAYTPNFHGLIFCKTRAEVDTVSNKLIADGYGAAAIHGEISQGQRENTLKQFRDKRINILIATDVAARGIDVADLNIVINYSLPQSPELYVHRIGRTGRAGKKGKAITFLMPSEKSKLKFVEKIIKQKISKGTLPGIEDIITAKKAHIETTIIELLQDKSKNEYDEIAAKLLSISDPQHVVATVLKQSFASQLDSKKYQEVGNVTGYEKTSRGGSRGGRSRYQGDRRSGSRGGSSGRGDRGGSRGGRGRDSGSRSPRRDGGFHGSRDKPAGRGREGGKGLQRGSYKPRSEASSGRGSGREGGRGSSFRPKSEGRGSSERSSFKPKVGGFKRDDSKPRKKKTGNKENEFRKRRTR